MEIKLKNWKARSYRLH